jgi:hypothetical protein
MSVSLCPPMYLQFMNPNNTGTPAAGFKLFTYQAGTSIKQNTWTDSTQTTTNTNPIILDSNGAVYLWGDPTLLYKFVFTTPSDTDPPVSPLRSEDNIAFPVTNAMITTGFIGALLYPQTAAESSASVTPSSLIYPPGDLRRYGATVGGDVTTPFASACSQAQQAGGAAVYIPGILGTGCTVTAGVSLTAPVLIYGDGYGKSLLTTANDITVITAGVGASTSIFRGFGLVGKGSGATLPGVLYTNSNNNGIERMLVKNFGVGVRYATGANSSYLNSIRDSQIISNQSINIDAQKSTNRLTLNNVTFGGGPCATGLKILDSNGLSVYGGDCEGMTLCCFDIDNPTVVGAGNHLISGVDLEGGTCSGGDIRVGNSNINAVLVLTIQNCTYNPQSGDDSAVNVVNAIGVLIIGGQFLAGYSGGGLTDGWIRLGANAKSVMAMMFENTSNSLSPFKTYGTMGQVIGGDVSVGGKFACNAATAVAQITGFGAPTGNSVVANYPGASATLVQTSNTVAEILAVLLRTGLIGA